MRNLESDLEPEGRRRRKWVRNLEPEEEGGGREEENKRGQKKLGT